MVPVNSFLPLQAFLLWQFSILYPEFETRNAQNWLFVLIFELIQKKAPAQLWPRNILQNPKKKSRFELEKNSLILVLHRMPEGTKMSKIAHSNNFLLSYD